MTEEDCCIFENWLTILLKVLTKSRFSCSSSSRDLKAKRSMRWHPLIIRFALSIKYSSTSAYNTPGHFFMLPSKRSLRDYTHWMKFESGMNSDVIKSLRKEISQEGFNPMD